MKGTFSESWYRIAAENIRLRSGIRVHRQNYRGERWYVLENPFSNQFFRLRPAAYEFIARLERTRTVQEVWDECVDRFPEDAPGQEEVIRLLSQLYHGNLLSYDVATDARQLFERQKKRKERELKARLTSIMFMRFPLLNPDRFLVKTLPLLKPLLGWIGLVLWLGVVGFAAKVAIENASRLGDESQGILSSDNILLLYLALAITKCLHEFGHAYFCRKYGGEVHVMGIMLLIFTPIPYVDASSSWGFKSKWQRVLVGSAGMIVEIFVGAIAVFIWANTGPGTLHNLAYNMVFLATVSTVLFNANPLLRFDGYYILSDLIEVPNLHKKAADQLKYLGKRYLFGLHNAVSPARTKTAAFWLATFAILSQIYRIFIFTGIVLFVADRFLLLGLIMAVICVTGWIVVPLSKFAYYLASSPELNRSRPRAVAVTGTFVASIFAFLQFVPFPDHFRAPGIFEARQHSQIVTETDGWIYEVLASDGTKVNLGDPLLRMNNKELPLQLRLAKGSVKEYEMKLRESMRSETADLAPLREKLDAQREIVTKLENDIDKLVIRARLAGTWVAPNISESVGRFLARGSPVGLIVDPSSFEFNASVVQKDADRLFTRDHKAAEVRLPGQAGHVLHVDNIQYIPSEQRRLPSPIIGWSGGGEIQTDPSDPEGIVTKEPFFSVRADVVNSSASDVILYHGQSAKIRFPVGWQPLLPKWVRRFRQMLQRRYQI